ncbi:hypothetical protein [Streptomyces jumonjinensis]|uniref:hypothetical protein n=1 Tax=Streptomyces jumonjinensis TaxID=1945 RepID=UPI00378E0897
MRLRIRRIDWPRRALVIGDTPRPDCPRCHGHGGWDHHYGDPVTGEYAGTDWEPCRCWDEDRYRVLLPLPRLPRRRTPYVDPWATTDYSNEPPS